MSVFSLHRAEEFGLTKVPVFMLCNDGRNLIYEMIDEIKREGVFGKEIPKLFSIVEQFCNLQRLPETKFKQLNIKSDLGKVYEAKSKHLRMYLVHIEKTGRTIILLGKKANQKKDINQLKSLLSLMKDQEELLINL